MIRNALIAATTLVAASTASAGLVVNDTFNYGGSNLGSGYGSWEDGTNNAQYLAGSTASWAGGDSDYVLLPSGASAGGLLTSSNAAGLPAARGAQLDLGTPLPQTFWVSVLLRMTSTTGTGVSLIGFENGGYSNGGFDHNGFGVQSNGSIVTTQGTTITDTNADVPTDAISWNLFLAKITVNNSGTASSTDDSLKLWVFDASSVIGGQTEALLGTPAFASTSMRFGNTIQDVWAGHLETADSGGAQIDNLRISDLSTDNGLKEVLSGTPIPEPASLAGLALASMLVIRRRR